MRRWRGHASVLVVCAVVIVGAVAALIVTDGAHQATARASTTGPLAPITVKRPSVPIIGGGSPSTSSP